jgi:hypothetical protein
MALLPTFRVVKRILLQKMKSPYILSFIVPSSRHFLGMLD